MGKVIHFPGINPNPNPKLCVDPEPPVYEGVSPLEALLDDLLDAIQKYYRHLIAEHIDLTSQEAKGQEMQDAIDGLSARIEPLIEKPTLPCAWLDQLANKLSDELDADAWERQWTFEVLSTQLETLPHWILDSHTPLELLIRNRLNNFHDEELMTRRRKLARALGENEFPDIQRDVLGPLEGDHI